MAKRGLKSGDTGNDVASLQSFLKRYGYLRPDMPQAGLFSMVPVDRLPEATPGRFDEATQTALSEFQKYYGLKATGEVDDETLRALHLPRCGVPDAPAPGAGVLGVGDPWARTDLTYGFLEITNKIPSEAQARNAMIEALAIWSAVTPLRFREIPITDNPNFVIRFVAGKHGDGFPFDGPRGTLAHAFFPPPNGGDIAGDAHFDDAENWTVNVPVGNNEFDLLTVAAHEFGHSLGLAHTNDISAMMFPAYLGSRRYLDGDDVPRIQTLYGRAVDDGGPVLGRCGAPDLVYTSAGELDLYTSTAVFGLRRRRMRNGRWLQWEDLGGEDGMKASVNTRTVAQPTGNRELVFTFSTNKEIHYRVFDAAGGSSGWMNIGGRRGDAFFSVADAGGVVAQITSRYPPDSTPGDAELPSDAPCLYEKIFDGVSFGPWNQVESNATHVAEIAEGNAALDVLLVADDQGAVKYARGSAGAWGDFQTLDGNVRVDIRHAFEPIAAVFAAPDDLHVFVRSDDNRLMHKRSLNGAWQPWQTLSDRVRHDPWAVASGSGRVHVLTNNENLAAMIRTFDGNWSNWVNLAGQRFRQVAAAAATRDRVDYLLRDSQSIMMHDFVTF